MDATQDIAGVALVIAGFVVTFIVGLAVVVRWFYQGLTKVRQGVRVLDRLEAVVSHELKPNGGSSMRDDVSDIARKVGELWGDVDDIKAHLGLPHGRKKR